MKLPYRTQKNAEIMASITGKSLNKPDWYEIKAESEDNIEIIIYDYIGWPYNDPRDLLDQLSGIENEAVLVRINSPGGDVFDAIAIFNALQSHKTKITTRVESLAASAASLIALAGKEVQIYKNAMLMIHNPWMYAAGDQNDFREMAELLDKITGNMIDIYSGASKLGKKTIKTMLNDETWMTAKEAKDHGFVKTILDSKAVKADFKLDIYNNLPPQLVIGRDAAKDQEIATQALIDAGFSVEVVKDIVSRGLSCADELKQETQRVIKMFRSSDNDGRA